MVPPGQARKARVLVPACPVKGGPLRPTPRAITVFLDRLSGRTSARCPADGATRPAPLARGVRLSGLIADRGDDLIGELRFRHPVPPSVYECAAQTQPQKMPVGSASTSRTNSARSVDSRNGS